MKSGWKDFVQIPISQFFSRKLVDLINDDFSDHLPILLSLQGKKANNGGRRKKRFRFENVWIHYEVCRDVISSVWEGINHVHPWNNLKQKSEVCIKALRQRDFNVFGNIRREIKMVEEKLKEGAEIKELSALRKKEEIMWAQRAKARLFKAQRL